MPEKDKSKTPSKKTPAKLTKQNREKAPVGAFDPYINFPTPPPQPKKK